MDGISGFPDFFFVRTPGESRMQAAPVQAQRMLGKPVARMLDLFANAPKCDVHQTVSGPINSVPQLGALSHRVKVPCWKGEQVQTGTEPKGEPPSKDISKTGPTLMNAKWVPSHQLTWKCIDPCRTTRLLSSWKGGLFALPCWLVHFHVSWWEGMCLLEGTPSFRFSRETKNQTYLVGGFAAKAGLESYSGGVRRSVPLDWLAQKEIYTK